MVKGNGNGDTVKKVDANSLTKELEDWKKVTSTDRKEMQEPGKTTLLREISRKTDTLLANSDAGVGGISYVFFGLACTHLNKGEYLQAAFFFLMSVVMCVVKHRLPPGTLTNWLRKDTKEILKDIKKTLIGG